MHFKRDSGRTPGVHHQSVDRKDAFRRKRGLNLFERLRISKQDKIAANVQQHIRAIRAAEALDRQTGKNRRKNSKYLIFGHKKTQHFINQKYFIEDYCN